MKISIDVSNIAPPVPSRNFDWQATLSDYEGGDPIGHGPNKWAAIADLMQNLELAEA